MKIKTYGINGLTDWQGDLKAGSISVRVSFTGGTASPSGAQPAYFVTKDPITQFVIENSKEFKTRFIHIEMVQEVPGEHHRMAVPKPKPVTPATTEEPKDPGEDEVKEGGEEPTEEDPTKEPDEEPADDGSIHVADMRDAIDWLKENFPEKKYTVTKLRTKEAFDAACADCGVTFVFTA